MKLIKTTVGGGWESTTIQHLCALFKWGQQFKYLELDPPFISTSNVVIEYLFKAGNNKSAALGNIGWRREFKRNCWHK